MSYQGKQIRNPDGVEGTFGILCYGYPFFEHLVLFFSLFFFLSGVQYQENMVCVCVSLIIVHVYIVARFLNLRKYFSFS